MTPLAGHGVVVTRPATESAHLAQLIRDAGGTPLLFPVLEIVPLATPALADVVARLAEFDIAIFISPSAVAMAWEYVSAHGAWPARLAWAAVGAGSARALARRGIARERVIAPQDRYDSEALLALPELTQAAGKRIVIFRGSGGRELLAQTLAERGAHVEYAECYRRACPQADIAPLLAAHARREVHAVTMTSSEGLRNYFSLLGGADGPQRGLLLDTPLFAAHPRIAAAARERGVARVIDTAQGDDGLLAGLNTWFAPERTGA